ncbi:MAG: hypothetical protein ACLQAT_11790 [Candidatus Binataceae bacterium]
MSDQSTRGPKKSDTDSDTEHGEQSEARAAKVGQEHQGGSESDNRADTQEVCGNISPVILRESWWSPRTLLDLVLILFTGGVMFATCQYSETAKKAQRPWVGIVMVGTYTGAMMNENFTLAPDAPVDITVGYRNFGNSPATHSAIYFRTMLGAVAPTSSTEWKEDTAPPIPDCHEKIDQRVGGPAYQGNSGESYWDRQDADEIPSFSAPDVDLVKNLKKSLYVVGCIGYVDEWGSRHHSDFCMYLYHPINVLAGQFAFCGKGNTAD